MSVLKRWNGTEWEIIGAPTRGSNGYFTIDSNDILTITNDESGEGLPTFDDKKF